MVYVYMDSGTSNTRAYLLRDGALLAEAKAPVGDQGFRHRRGQCRVGEWDEKAL